MSDDARVLRSYRELVDAATAASRRPDATRQMFDGPKKMLAGGLLPPPDNVVSFARTPYGAIACAAISPTGKLTYVGVVDGTAHVHIGEPPSTRLRGGEYHVRVNDVFFAEGDPDEPVFFCHDRGTHEGGFEDNNHYRWDSWIIRVPDIVDPNDDDFPDNSYFVERDGVRYAWIITNHGTLSQPQVRKLWKFTYNLETRESTEEQVDNLHENGWLDRIIGSHDGEPLILSSLALPFGIGCL